MLVYNVDERQKEIEIIISEYDPFQKYDKNFLNILL